MDDTAQPIRGSYLAALDTILNGQDISNRRTVLEQLILSLLRVLYTLDDDSKNIYRFLCDILDKGPSLLQPLDGVSDQYCARRIRGHKPQQSFRGSQ